jgi:hypothetical protein
MQPGKPAVRHAGPLLSVAQRVLRSPLDCAHDPEIGAAAADIAGHMGNNLIASRLRIIRKQFGSS